MLDHELPTIGRAGALGGHGPSRMPSTAVVSANATTRIGHRSLVDAHVFQGTGFKLGDALLQRVDVGRDGGHDCLDQAAVGTRRHQLCKLFVVHGRPQYATPDNDATPDVRIIVNPNHRSTRNASRFCCHSDSTVVLAVGGLSGAVSICAVDCSLLPGTITSALPTMAVASNSNAAEELIESDAIAVTPGKISPPLIPRSG